MRPWPADMPGELVAHGSSRKERLFQPDPSSGDEACLPDKVPHSSRKKRWRVKKVKSASEPASTLKVSEYTVSHQTNNWEATALAIFRKSGFVVVEDVLNDVQCREVLEVCNAVAKEMVGPHCAGNRGHGRYSFGWASSTGSILHERAIASNLLSHAGMILHPLLCSIFCCDEGKPQFSCYSGGGDFVLPGVEEYQPLHSDIQVNKSFSMKMPPPYLSVNFCVQALTAENGPIRMIPGKTDHDWTGRKEPAEWRNSRLFPVPAGAALVRDVRTLHGGTPNVSERTRYLPSIEYVSTGFKEARRKDMFPAVRSIPREIFNALPKKMRRLCRDIVAEEPEPGNELENVDPWKSPCWHGVKYRRM